jgi:ABC-2 type transport system permease protein
MAVELKKSFITLYLRNNIYSSLEYKFSFLTQIFGMFVNDVMWVTFWVLYFKKFPVVNGWGLNDLLIMWSTITFSFGMAFGLFANIARIPEMVLSGQLDYYLAHPKNVLLHIGVSQIRPVNLGDCVFGPCLLIFFVHPNFNQFLIFLMGSVLAAIVYLSYYIVIGSLAFFMGSSEGLFNNLANAMIHFSTYPAKIFDGWTRILLFTAIPAAFISELPVELVRNFQWIIFGKLFFGALVFLGIAVTIFNLGLKRYESGNLISMRS